MDYECCFCHQYNKYKKYVLQTESPDTNLPPTSLKSSEVTGDVWGPFTFMKFLAALDPCQMLISPFSQPVTRIFFSGCQTNDVI